MPNDPAHALLDCALVERLPDGDLGSRTLAAPVSQGYSPVTGIAAARRRSAGTAHAAMASATRPTPRYRARNGTTAASPLATRLPTIIDPSAIARPVMPT